MAAHPAAPGWALIPAHNLPAQPTSLVGRESEIEALRARLCDERVRLLTLTGTAGTGKTRLALAVAEAAAEVYPHGVWLVDLTPVTDPAGVLPAIVRTLGARSAGDAAAEEVLRLYLREKRLLLVLDNFEHVLDAAPAVAVLLDACPDLQVMTTSREPLRVRWERLAPVPPLRLPEPAPSTTPAELAEAPAIQLFVQRARDVLPSFELNERIAPSVAELCRRLDGLPLAIELAAARSRALPPEAILARLEHRLDLLVGGRRDEPARHQTVRAALAWSHELLSPPEQTLFRRLGVFVGGCTPEAAEAVCNAGGDLGMDVLEGLESLLARSLLRQDELSGEPRFSMLETVHAYAIEALQHSGELDAIRAAHAAYAVQLAQTAEVELRGPDQMRWLARLDRELANLRAALAGLVWRAAAGDTDAHERALLLVGAMWWYWHVRGDYAEARQIAAPLLAATPADRVSSGRALALGAAGTAAWGLGDYATARAEVEESLALHRALGDDSAMPQALIKVTVVAISQGDTAPADAAATEALAIARAIDDRWNEAWAMTFSGVLAIARGDLGSARRWFEASLVIRRRLGDTFGIAWNVNGLASVARLRGDAATARPLYEECLVTFRALGERPTVASILDGLGEVAIAQGDFAAARERFRESLDLYREVDSTRGIGIALSGFAALAAAEGRAERAVRLAGAATALHEAGGGAIELIKPRGSDAWLDEARQSLDDEAEQIWAAGRAMSPDEAVAYALAADPALRGSAPAVRGVGRGAVARGDDPLTAREREVAQLVAHGSSNRQIAEALVISERTAEAHVSNILSKLGLATRVQLATWVTSESPPRRSPDPPG